MKNPISSLLSAASNTAKAISDFIDANWRGFLARLPLPMLALAASYGVYDFTRLFVPVWVAIVQAAAFEATYIGLASYDSLNDEGRKRARLISGGAVAASVVYNTLAGVFHRQPALLTSVESVWWGALILAALHGVPLALVAYFVADLILHRAPPQAALPATPSTDSKPIVKAPPQGGFSRKRKPRREHKLFDKIPVKVERKPTPSLAPPPPALPAPSLAQLGFTQAQMDVLEMVRQGMTQEAIAAALGLKRQAVQDRLRNAMKVSAKTVKDIQREGARRRKASQVVSA
jgi:DNA-binding CsgD family transcriptional regulator